MEVNIMDKKIKLIIFCMTVAISAVLFIFILLPMIKEGPMSGIMLLFIYFSVLTLFALSFYGSLFIFCCIKREKASLCNSKITGLFSIITIFIIIIMPHGTGILTFIEDSLPFILAITTILLSRALTILIKNLKEKIISWIFAIIFGIASFFIFLSLSDILNRKNTYIDTPSPGLGFVILPICLIVSIISIGANIYEKQKINKKEIHYAF